ncbi:MAG: response regulator [Candidatus Thiodiazotropha sp. DIVDIV]
MNKQPRNNQQSEANSLIGEHVYYSLSFVASCMVLCGLVITYYWPISSLIGLSTLLLACQFMLIRLIQSLRHLHTATLLTRSSSIILDQLYLSLITFTGSSILLFIPLSSLLIFGARSFGRNYLWLAMVTGFISITSTLNLAFEMDLLQAVLLSLLALCPPALVSIRKNSVATQKSHQPYDIPELPQLEEISSENPEIPKQNKHFNSAPVDQKTERVLILSRNTTTTSLLSQQLFNWGHETTTCSNSLQAFKHMLSRRQGEVFTPYSYLIVDGENLDIEPLSLARLIKNEPLLSEVRLICIQSSFFNEKYAHRLLRAGYHTLLESPWSKEQLFSIISYDPDAFTPAENVVSLIKHRTVKKAYTRQKEILLADAPTQERESLGRALSKAGYNIHLVDNGDQALDALEEHFFDLAIINLQLPVMSGIQVVKLHRFTTPYKQWVPFIFMNEEDNPEVVNLCHSIGVDICLFKPITPQEVMLSILAALDKGDLQNLTYVSRKTDPIQFKNNRIQDAMLLDHMTLLRLEKLDSGISFINDLFKIFEAEGRGIIRQMESAVAHRQLGLFLDQAQILLDSAGQLGAVLLYELSQQAAKLSAREFEYKGSDMLSEIEQTFNLTLQAYALYLSQRASATQSEPNSTPFN